MDAPGLGGWWFPGGGSYLHANHVALLRRLQGERRRGTGLKRSLGRPALPAALQMRCYDVQQLSMKFDRHLDSEIVDFQILSEDYSKAVFLCADRRCASRLPVSVSWLAGRQHRRAVLAYGQASCLECCR